jgi:hypothetical protein
VASDRKSYINFGLVSCAFHLKPRNPANRARQGPSGFQPPRTILRPFSWIPKSSTFFASPIYIYIYVSELADGRSGGIRQVSGVLKETPGGIREFLWEEAIGSLTEVSGRHARHPGYTMW